MKKNRKIAGLSPTFMTLIVVMVVSIVSCVKSIDRDLENNKRIWAESNTQNYDFQIVKHGGALSDLRPVLIHVRDRVAVSTEPPTNAGHDNYLRDYGEFNTIEQCFATIQRSYDEGYKVKVEYNNEFGYPEHIWVQNESGTDNFYSLDISGFTVVKN